MQMLSRYGRRRTVAVMALASAAALAGTTAAGAAPTGFYAPFDQCPVSNSNVQTCLVSDTTSGSFKLGNQSVPITKRIRLQGGFSTNEAGESTFYPAANGKTLEKTKLNVPGGLLGITIPSLVPEPIRSALQDGIDTVNGVEATAELVGPVKFSWNNLLFGDNEVIRLPLRVKLDNPFLGDNCYIGSASNPLTLSLTPGTTHPPAGYTPMVGYPGDFTFEDEAHYVRADNISLVDNNFKAPKANGCGGIFFSWAIDPVVNLKIGLEASAGKSEARMTGTAHIGDRNSVIASGG